jgi:hypothetical protein
MNDQHQGGAVAPSPRILITRNTADVAATGVEMLTLFEAMTEGRNNQSP